MQLWTETVFKLAWDLPDTQPLFKQDGKRSQNVNVLAALGGRGPFTRRLLTERWPQALGGA